MITRFQAAKTKKKAQIALLLNTPIIIVYLSIVSLIGLIIYATYHNRDPLECGDITRADQMSSYFVLDRLNTIPGVIGLFMGAIFCSSLSSLSSYLNSLSFLIWEDFMMRFSYFQSFNNQKKLRTNKFIVFVCGTLATGICYGISTSSLNIAPLNNSLNGMLNG